MATGAPEGVTARGQRRTTRTHLDKGGPQEPEQRSQERRREAVPEDQSTHAGAGPQDTHHTCAGPHARPAAHTQARVHKEGEKTSAGKRREAVPEDQSTHAGAPTRAPGHAPTHTSGAQSQGHAPRETQLKDPREHPRTHAR